MNCCTCAYLYIYLLRVLLQKGRLCTLLSSPVHRPQISSEAMRVWMAIYFCWTGLSINLDLPILPISQFTYAAPWPRFYSCVINFRYCFIKGHVTWFSFYNVSHMIEYKCTGIKWTRYRYARCCFWCYVAYWGSSSISISGASSLGITRPSNVSYIVLSIE